MKQPVKLLLLISMAGGGVAFAARALQNRTGFDENGLPVAGNLPGAVLPFLLIVLVASVWLLAGKLPKTGGSFPASFFTQSTGVFTAAVMGCFLWIASGLWQIFGLSAPGAILTEDGLSLIAATPSFVPLLDGALPVLSGVCLLVALTACRGGRRTDHTASGSILLAPVVLLVMRLVLAYRIHSINPALSAYYVELLALVCLILALYRTSSFAFGAASPRQFCRYTSISLIFCLATLGDCLNSPALLLFYAGGAVLMLSLLLLWRAPDGGNHT